MPLPTLATAAAIALAPSLQAPALPAFEELGNALLAAAAKERPKGAPVPSDLAGKLLPLFERIRLGGVELWIPKRTLDERGRIQRGFEPKDVQPIVTAVAELEGPWLERAGAKGEALERAHEAQQAIEAWTRELRGPRFEAAPEEVVAGVREIETLFFGAPLTDEQRERTLLLAPTRAHYAAVLGAAGVIDPDSRATYWTAAARRSLATAMPPHFMLLALEMGPDEDAEPPLRGEAIEPEFVVQSVVHSASHELTISITPMATAWLGEGLALCDTIGVCGADETLCTGHAELSAGVNVPGGGAAGILLWVTRHKSPYRESGSPRYFRDELASAWSSEGFQVLDLDLVRPAFKVRVPLVGRPELPTVVGGMSSGVKKGFAELYRAYSAAFVHWLDRERAANSASALTAIMAELSAVPYDARALVHPLDPIFRRVTGKGLNAIEPVHDIEAAFIAWLTR